MPTVQLQAGGSLRLPMSFDDFLALGETKHYEYYDGLVLVNPPTRRHVLVQSRLTRLLQDSKPTGYEALPDWGWAAARQKVFEPDIMVFRSDAPGPDLLRAAPLIVVEVTSPSTRAEDFGRKREIYAQGGAEWYWLVDPDADTILILRNQAGRFVQVQTYAAPGIHRVTRPFPVQLDLFAIFAD